MPTVNVTITDTLGASATATATANISSSGYDNINNWPSAVNRPSVSGSTLSWIGPSVPLGSAGGYHASTTSDIQQTRTLTTQTSAINSTTAGQVIEGLDLTVNINNSANGCAINVTSNNVTIRQCRITASPVSGAYGLAIAGNGHTGLVIEDCLIRGPGDNTGGNCYLMSGDTGLNTPFTGTVARCNLSGAIKSVGQQVQNLLYIDNWCHDWAGQPEPDNDWCAVWLNSSNSTFQHNYFDQRTVAIGFNWGNPDTGGEQDSCLNCTTYQTTTSITDIYLIGNALVGDSTKPMVHFCFWDAYQNNNKYPKNVKCVNNGFYGYQNSSGNQSGSIGTGCTVLANSGNFIMATPTDTSGSPLNGNGQLAIG